MAIKLYDRKPPGVQWSHGIKLKEDDKAIVDEVIEKYKKEGIDLYFNGAIRHMINEYGKYIEEIEDGI